MVKRATKKIMATIWTSPNEPDSLGPFIRRAREAVGLSTAEASRRIGISRPYLARIERGEIHLPSRDIVQALSTTLGIRRRDILIAAGFLDMPVRQNPAPQNHRLELDKVLSHPAVAAGLGAIVVREFLDNLGVRQQSVMLHALFAVQAAADAGFTVQSLIAGNRRPTRRARKGAAAPLMEDHAVEGPGGRIRGIGRAALKSDAARSGEE